MDVKDIENIQNLFEFIHKTTCMDTVSIDGEKISYHISVYCDESDLSSTFTKLVSSGSTTKLFNIDDTKKIILKNVSDYVKDRKNFTGLDFHDAYQLTSNSITGLINGLYRIKSHKFDKWYEFYSEITEVEEDTDCVTISVRFKHGEVLDEY